MGGKSRGAMFVRESGAVNGCECPTSGWHLPSFFNHVGSSTAFNFRFVNHCSLFRGRMHKQSNRVGHRLCFELSVGGICVVDMAVYRALDSERGLRSCAVLRKTELLHVVREKFLHTTAKRGSVGVFARRGSEMTVVETGNGGFPVNCLTHTAAQGPSS